MFQKKKMFLNVKCYNITYNLATSGALIKDLKIFLYLFNDKVIINEI